MAITDIAQLARFELVMGGFITTHFGGDVEPVWSDQDTPRRPRPYITLKWLTQPAARSQAYTERIQAPTLVSVTHANTAPGTERLLFVNGYRISATGDDDDGIRDAQLEAIQASGEPVVVEVGGAGELTIAPVAFGDLRRVRAVPQDPDHLVVVASSSAVSYNTTKLRGTLSLNVYSAEATGPASAGVIMTDLLDALGNVQPVLKDAGIGFATIPAARDLSTIMGTEREGRQQVDIGIYLCSRRASAATTIQSLELAGDIDGALIDDTITP